jgi:hypothetical protein
MRPGERLLILRCHNRTSTFLSCAFREQEDDQAALASPFQARSPSLNKEA